MLNGINVLFPKLDLPFQIVETIANDPKARDLSVEAAKPDIVMTVTRLNDAILLVREMVKQQFDCMGIISSGSPGMYERQFAKALGKYPNQVSSTVQNQGGEPHVVLPKVVAAKSRLFPVPSFRSRGYLREYRVEQIVRDGRITQIYEGTNGIQAATLAGRLLRLDDGAPAKAFRADIKAVIAKAIPETAMALEGALALWDGAMQFVSAKDDTGLVADSFMRMTGLLAFAACFARLEAAAGESAAPQRLHAVASFVRDWMLPQVSGLAANCSSPLILGELPAEVFSA